MDMERRRPIGGEDSGMLVTFTMVLLVLEFIAALWIQGIIFAAVLFGLMSLALAIAIGAVYVFSLRTASRRAASRYATARSLLLIALVSSASLALLAGLFALPLLFNGSRRSLRPEWKVPSVLGACKTHAATRCAHSAVFCELHLL
jgi:hypothetical protein